MAGIALLLLLLAGIVWWAGYRVLPTVDGSIQAEIGQPGSIARDERGIPTIQAASIEDALFLQGYATAQDRMFQMDSIRRKAAGELSEVVGAGAMELDADSRRLRMRRIAEMHARSMPAGDRQLLAAYARGVNHFLRTHRGKAAMEFGLLGYDPKPWTVTDSVLAGLEMYRSLTTTWKHDLQKQTMLAGGLKDKVEQLFPLRTGRELQPGSNAWAVAGTHTATGKALLSNDPHLGWTMPSTWHAVRIQAGDLQVAGVALPGVPGIIVGHNRNIAWGVTNLGFDVQDLYQEKVDLQGLRYEYQGQVFPLLVDRDVIQIRGERPRNFDVALTRHGPLIELQGNQAMALRWMAAEAGSFQFPFLELNLATNWEQFRTALRRFPGPGQNFVYADKDGNIGYQTTGLLPIRKGALGDTPVAGWTGENEWTGVIPFDELPSIYNPPSGYIVTANQNPFPADYKYPVHGDFAATYRAEQIRGLLASRPRIAAGDMAAVQTDVYSAFSRFLASQLVKAYAASGKAAEFPDLAGAVEQLKSWDGQMERGKAAPMIAVLAFQRVRAAIGEKAAVGRGSIYADQYAPVVIENLLRSRPKGWFDDWDRMLLQQLTLAIDEGRTLQGSMPDGWDYGEYNAVSIPNPVVSRVPGIGEWLGYFNVGPVAMAGSSTTVKQTTKNIGPSMRFTADLADWEQSRLNLTIGESGHLLSPNYKDQWESYWSGGSTNFAFEKPEQRHLLRVTPAASR